MRKAIILALLAASGAVGWLYWRQHQPVPLVVSGFIEADEIRVGSRVGGRVAEVLTSEGQQVQAGTALVRIDPFDLKEELARARAELAAREAEYEKQRAGYRAEEIAQARARRDQAAAVLAKLEAGPRPDEIRIARERLNIANANLQLADSEFQRVRELREEGSAPKTEYDQADRTYKATQGEASAARLELDLLEQGTRKEEIARGQAALAEAEHALELLEQGYRAEDVARAAAQVEAARAQVAAIEIRLRELTITSPCACEVETIDLRPGDLLAPNAPVVALLDTSRLWVRAYVPEAHLGRLQIGGKVAVRVDGFGDERFTGRITFIAQQGEFTPRNIQTPEERSKQVFRIKATLENGLDRLRVGMSADVLLDEVPGS